MGLYDGQSSPFSLSGLVESGLGLATGGLGGLLGSWGLSQLTDSTSKTQREANQSLLQDAQKFQLANMYNAAGRTGAAVQNSFDQQFNSLTNSAEARSAANAQNMMAGKALSSGQGIMNQAAQTSERSSNTQTQGLLDMLRSQGASPAAMMAVANRMGDVNSQVVGQQAASQSQAAQQSIGQAAQMYGNANQILNSDLSNRYNVFVKPFEAQSSGLGNAMMQTIPGAMQSVSEQKSVTNPLAGFAGGLGYFSRQSMAQPWNNQGYNRSAGLFAGGYRNVVPGAYGAVPLNGG